MPLDTWDNTFPDLNINRKISELLLASAMPSISFFFMHSELLLQTVYLFCQDTLAYSMSARILRAVSVLHSTTVEWINATYR